MENSCEEIDRLALILNILLAESKISQQSYDFAIQCVQKIDEKMKGVEK
jgi:hypothetical protein